MTGTQALKKGVFLTNYKSQELDQSRESRVYIFIFFWLGVYACVLSSREEAVLFYLFFSSFFFLFSFVQKAIEILIEEMSQRDKHDAEGGSKIVFFDPDRDGARRKAPCRDGKVNGSKIG